MPGNPRKFDFAQLVPAIAQGCLDIMYKVVFLSVQSHFNGAVITLQINREKKNIFSNMNLMNIFMT